MVEFTTKTGPGTGFAYDLSAVGIFVRSIHFPKPGTAVSAELILKDGKRIPLRGVVVRSFRAPPALHRLFPSGFSLHLQERPEEYFQLLATL